MLNGADEVVDAAKVVAEGASHADEVLDAAKGAANAVETVGEHADEGIDLYRTMQEGANGGPLLGNAKDSLGVVTPADIPPRSPSNMRPDITSDLNGNVHPGTGGMSVTPNDYTQMPPNRRPSWVPGGRNTNPLWHINSNQLGPDLVLRQDAPYHAVVEPARSMPYNVYQQALWNLQDLWEKIVP